MKKILLCALVIVFAITNLVIAQGNEADFSKYKDQFQNEHRCHTDEFTAFQKANDPNYSKKLERLRARVLANSNARMAQNAIPCTAGNSLVVPVAVHYDSSFDCSDVQCLIDAATNSLASLNIDFAATNADITLYNQLNAVCSTGYPLSYLGDGTCISFCLATLDHPAGEGIAEGQPAITIGQYQHSSGGGSGAAPWAGYLNMFVQSGTGFLGVANAPGQANGDGVMVDAVTWGGPGIACSSGTSLNTNTTYNLGRTLTHEVGHYFDLYHTFQGGCNNNDTGTFSGQVNVINDTPPTSSSFFGCPNVAGYTSCADVPNSCSGTPTQFTNYMDYTDDACMVMFSMDQSSVMNGWANGLNFKSNATTCGALTNNSLSACSLTPIFTPSNNSNTLLCLDEGNTLQLLDQSTNGPVSWNWSAQNVSGNLVYSPDGAGFSTMQNPVLTFSSAAGTSGTISVTLIVCDAGNVCDTVTNSFNVSLVQGDDCPDDCTHTLEMTDTFGDGWNGASLDIQQDGTSIPGSPFTFTSGSTSGPITLTLTDGSTVDFIQTNGTYPSEEGFNVTDQAGNVVVNIPSSAPAGVAASIIVDCSAVAQCNIQSSGLTVSPCNDNGTVTDPSDDTFTFTLDPTGVLIVPGNSYLVTGDINAPGNYGSPVTFDNGGAGYPAGTDLNIVINDVLDNTCTLALTVSAPQTCSTTTLVGCGDLFTDSGGSGGNYSNDELQTYLVCPDNPGSELVQVTFTSFATESCCDDLTAYDGPSTASPVIGSYAGTTSPGVLTSTDVASGCLTFVFDSDFSVVSSGWTADVICLSLNACNILNTGLVISACNDNGTNNDSNDDFYTFDLNPTGFLLGTGYTVTESVSGATVGIGVYGAATTFGPFFTSSPGFDIVITDDSDTYCTATETIVNPGSCSPFSPYFIGDCIDFDAGIPTNLVQSATDNFDWSIGSSTPSAGTGPQNGDHTSGSGQFIYIETSSPVGVGEIVEISFSADLSGSTNPSVQFYYDMLGAQIGTLNVLVDDGLGNITTEFTISGNQGGGWTLAVADLTAFAGTNVVITFQAITNGSYEGDISLDDICLIDANQCNIISSGIVVSPCNDNGTNNDSNDDFYTFDLNPTGSILGTGYTVTESVSGATVGIGVYGAATTFGPFFTSSPGFDIVITDDSDTYCTATETIVNPGSCSPFSPYFIGDCIDFDAGIPTNLVQSATDNFDWSIGSSTPSLGTGPQNGDNTSGSGQFIYIETSAPVGVGEIVEISFSADLSGSTNPSVQFYYDMLGAQIGTLNVLVDDGLGNITTEFTISGDQGGGWTLAVADLTAFAGTNVVITFQAITNGSFEGDISLDDICLIDANQCNIISSGIVVSPCNDNGTPSDSSDDSFTFSLNPSGTLLTPGNSYTVSGDINGSGIYGASTIFDNNGAGYATGTDLNIIITDDLDYTCILTVAVAAPFSCSDSPACGNIFVDSGGTTGVYGNNELSEVNICPDNPGDTVQLVFTFVDIETTSGTGIANGCWDFLTIYNGPTTGSPVLAQTLCGELDGDGGVPSDPNSLLVAGDSFQSTDASGCLTVVFDSDGSVTDEGWEADVNCLPGAVQCLPFLNVSGLIPSGVYQADDFLVSDGSINAGSGGAVSFYAGANPGEYIELTTGFDCDGTQDFEAVNIQCNPND